LVTGFASFLINNGKGAKALSLLSSVITLVLALVAVYSLGSKDLLNYDAAWIPALGSRFSLAMDGMAKMLCLLTAVSLPLVFTATYKNNYNNPRSR